MIVLGQEEGKAGSISSNFLHLFALPCDMRDILNWRKVAGFSIGPRVQRRVSDEVQALWRATCVMPVIRRAPRSKVM